MSPHMKRFKLILWKLYLRVNLNQIQRKFKNFEDIRSKKIIRIGNKYII